MFRDATAADYNQLIHFRLKLYVTKQTSDEDEDKGKADLEGLQAPNLEAEMHLGGRNLRSCSRDIIKRCATWPTCSQLATGGRSGSSFVVRPRSGSSSGMFATGIPSGVASMAVGSPTISIREI